MFIIMTLFVSTIVLIVTLVERRSVYRARIKKLQAELDNQSMLAARYYSKMRSYEKMLSGSISMPAKCGGDPKACEEKECKFPECTYTARKEGQTRS